MQPLISKSDLLCAVHINRKEVVNLVCLAPGCIGSGLLCRLCVNEKHAAHEVVTTIKLAQDIDNCKYDQSTQALAQKTIATIKQARIKCMSAIGNIRNQLIKMLADKEKQVNDYFQRLQEAPVSLVKQLGAVIPGSSSAVFNKTLAEANEAVKQAIGQFTSYISTKKKTDSLIREKLQTCQQNGAMVYASTNKLLIQAESILSQITLELHEPQSLMKPPREFSGPIHQYNCEKAFLTSVPNPYFSITSNKATSNFNGLGSRCVLFSTVLDGSLPNTTYICRISFSSIRRYHPCVGVGNTRLTIDNNYSLNPQRVTILYNDGSLYSNSVQSTKTPVVFGDNDEVRLLFNTQDMLLTVRCNDNQHSVKVASSPKDQLRFLAYLYGNGSTVEILK